MTRTILKKSIFGVLFIVGMIYSSPARSYDDGSALQNTFLSYFVAPKYAEAVKKGLSYVGMPDDRYVKLLNFDFRDLKLGAPYKQVMAFIKQEDDVCQSTMDNFYGVKNLLGIGGGGDPVSQSMIGCQHDVFKFTPLGRLWAYDYSFWSEERSTAVMKRLEDKIPDIKWNRQCDGWEGNVSSAFDLSGIWVTDWDQSVKNNPALQKTQGGHKDFLMSPQVTIEGKHVHWKDSLVDMTCSLTQFDPSKTDYTVNGCRYSNGSEGGSEVFFQLSVIDGNLIYHADGGGVENVYLKNTRTGSSSAQQSTCLNGKTLYSWGNACDREGENCWENNVELIFNEGSKRLVNGKMQYKYELQVNAIYLQMLDTQAIGKALVKDSTPTPTKL